MMSSNGPCRIALVYPGDRAASANARAEESRFAQVFHALQQLGARPEAAVYHDEFVSDVRKQLMDMDGVLVWVNPVEEGRGRSTLDAMLREVAAAGIFVSAHPDVILKLGTKEVLYQTRDMTWGCDTHIYLDMEQMKEQLPQRLAHGTRVLKQYRGNGGEGVWKVELTGHRQGPGGMLTVWHAKRGCVRQTMTFDRFMDECRVYFAANGRIIDQAYQDRLTEGMVRCYLVHNKVAGFGRQAITALCPAPAGAPPEAVPLPSRRYYHPSTMPEFQSLKLQLENEWMPEIQRRLQISTEELPVIWDCDFLFGPKTPEGEDTYVLGEINVSSVSPFPDSAVQLLAEAVLAQSRKPLF